MKAMDWHLLGGAYERSYSAKGVVSTSGRLKWRGEVGLKVWGHMRKVVKKIVPWITRTLDEDDQGNILIRIYMNSYRMYSCFNVHISSHFVWAMVHLIHVIENSPSPSHLQNLGILISHSHSTLLSLHLSANFTYHAPLFSLGGMTWNL